jgi:hypothetical protein
VGSFCVGLRGLSARLCTIAIVVGAAGCGVGLRTGGSVARTTAPVELMSTIGEPSREVDASLTGKFVDLQTVVDVRHVRALFLLGFGSGHARYRSLTPAGEPIFAKDDNVNFRAGVGVGFAPVHVGRVRPAPYVMYVAYPLGSDNTVKRRFEVGVDIELEERFGDRGALQLILGAGLTYETGLSYADFQTNDTYKSEYGATGVLVTLGVRALRDGLLR